MLHGRAADTPARWSPIPTPQEPSVTGTAEWTEQRHVVAQPPPPGAPAAYAPPVAQAANGFAVTALVCGIIGAVFGLIPLTFFIAWILGIIAVVFDVLGRRQRDCKLRGGRMATAGLVLGIIALALGVVGVAIVGDAAEDVDEAFDDIERCLDDPSAEGC